MSQARPAIEVVDNPEAGRYEARVDSRTAVLEYRLDDGELLLAHTEVPEELEGQGIGSALARHALEDARSRGLSVRVRCPFVRGYVRRHPEFEDLLAERSSDG